MELFIDLDVPSHDYLTIMGFGWKLGYINEFVELVFVDRESLLIDHGQKSSIILFLATFRSKYIPSRRAIMCDGTPTFDWCRPEEVQKHHVGC